MVVRTVQQNEQCQKPMVSNSLKKKLIQENANNNNHTIKKTKSQFCFTFIAADKYAQLRLFHHNSGSRTRKKIIFR